MKITGLLFSFILLLNSCAHVLQTFTTEHAARRSELTLYANSPFKEKIWDDRSKEKYFGRWTGSLKEDSVFTTTTTKHGYQILTLTPKTSYKIVKGKAIILVNRK